MVAPGPTSSINREYYAQEHEKEIEEGRGAIEAYQKTDEKAVELLKRLANSEAYSKRRRLDDDEEGEGSGMRALPAPEGMRGGNTPGAGSSRESRSYTPGNGRGGARGGRGGARGGRVFPSTARLPPSEEDWLPPSDTNIKSLFIVGVEDDLPEFKIREFFAKWGTLQSVVCSHRSHCAYINYVSRQDAEKAADDCHGRAVVAGCPLRVTWGRPKQLDTMDRDQRIANAREGRATARPQGQKRSAAAIEGAPVPAEEGFDSLAALAPPGADDVKYASLAGD